MNDRRSEFVSWFHSLTMGQRVEVWYECEAMTAAEFQAELAKLKTTNPVSSRDAWFEGWRAAGEYHAARELEFGLRHLDGDKFTWRIVPQPPNPYPETPCEQKP